MAEKYFKILGIICFCGIFSTKTGIALPAYAAQGQGESPHQENEVDVQGERTGTERECPISIHKGKILGVSHGVHTSYLPAVNVPYREKYTLFSVADGEKTYLVRRQGALHAHDYTGVIVTAPCRKTAAEVAKVGDLLDASPEE